MNFDHLMKDAAARCVKESPTMHSSSHAAHAAAPSPPGSGAAAAPTATVPLTKAEIASTNLADHALGLAGHVATDAILLLESAKKILRVNAEIELNQRTAAHREETKRLRDEERKIQEARALLTGQRGGGIAPPRQREPRAPRVAGEPRFSSFETTVLDYITKLDEKSAQGVSGIFVGLGSKEETNATFISDTVRKLLRAKLIHQQGLRRGAKYYRADGESAPSTETSDVTAADEPSVSEDERQMSLVK